MRTQAICLALMAFLLCPVASTQWVHTNYDGYVGVLAVSGTNLFAGDWHAGVFRSTDNGISWTAVNAGLTDTVVNCFAVSGTNLFAGTRGGVFHTTNNGTSWTQTGLTNVSVQSLCEWDGSLLAGTGDGGVYVSADTGKSWNSISFATPEWGVTSLAVSGTDIFAGTIRGGVFLTTDCGRSWTEIGGEGVPVKSLAFIGTTLFAGTADGYVCLTSNKGATWTCTLKLEQYYGVRCFAVSGSNLFAGTSGPFGGGEGVFLTTNNGATWTTVNSNLTGATPLAVLSLAVSGSNLFAGTSGGGVWRRPLSEMITGVEPVTSDVPHEFLLQQNYPNPFNPTTVISFQSPVVSDVRLSVFDVLGREVSVLVNERRDAGVHEVKFDGAGLSSGVYVYRLTAGDFVQSRKLMILR